MELEIVKPEIRDEIMKEICSIPSNKTCFDCGSRSPTWSSPYLGILICMECAGRHRGYGTHISFIKSINLDKWNKKQLKSLELTGNLYAKKKFEKLGVPKIDSIYDYNNELIFEIRKDIENLVKENLKPDDYTQLSIKKNNNTENEEEEDILNNLNIGNKKKHDEEKLEELKPVKFTMKSNTLNNKKEKIVKKKNKIKKIDDDFDFDDYENNSNNKANKEEEEKEELVDTKKISGMKLSRKDKKLLEIEERNKKKKMESKKGKSCCEKIREFIYNFVNLYKKK